MSARGVLRIAEGGLIQFWCAGCKQAHGVNSGWKFNGNYERPTFEPSVLVTGGHYLSSWKQGDPCWCTFNADHPDKTTKLKCERCHTFVRDGSIIFLDDCTHELAGKTVPLEPF